MTPPILTTTGRLTSLLRAGLVAGVILAALIFPLAAMSGLEAKDTARRLVLPPDDLLAVSPAQTTDVYANDGRTLLTMFYEEYRRHTPIARISPYVQQAIVASEDTRFYEHNGVDPQGVARAFVANTRSGTVAQGGSTLTMQYVRMAMRDSARTPAEVHAATEQTAGRKIREARMALEVEQRLTKTQILERYLNQAYFGHRAYGIFAAAEIFFSTRPENLDLTESALLAGLVQAPSGYDPATGDQRAAIDRRNWVIDRMVQLGYVSVEVAEEAKAQPIRLNMTEPANDCISVPRDHNDWGFFCDMFRSWWRSQPAFGSNPRERENRLRRGGYTVVTSLDPEVQSAAQEHVLGNESTGSPYAHGTVVIEPGTGLVKAMAVNRVYSLDQSGNGPHTDWSLRGEVPGSYPNTVNPLLGGGDLPGYQAGSTFKMFTMLAALDIGMPLSTTIYAPGRYRSQYPGWSPRNASSAMTGYQTMWSGFGKSVNTYFVQLLERIGTEPAVRMAERLGLRWRSDVDKMMAAPDQARTWGSFTLGVADTTPLEMANAYATVAADGRYCKPLPVLSITGRNGRPVTYTAEDGSRVEVAAPRCHQAVSPAVARAATDAARCVTGYRAATGSCGSWSTAPMVYRQAGSRPIAGKTGTTDSNRAAWFVGFTPQLAAASFIADPDNPLHAVGGGNAWKPIASVSWTLRDALADEPVRDFTPPPPSTVH